jgi:ribonuclease HI
MAKRKNLYSYNNEENQKFVNQLLEKKNIIIFTDGGALGNPGKGGYGAVLQFLKDGTIIRKEISGGFRETTNNRMELLAIIEALKSIKSSSIPISVFSDSKYVIDAINLGWAKKWQKNSWIKSNKEEAKNIDLWKELLALIDQQKINFYWVKGHANIVENERCDELANIVMKGKISKIDTYYEEVQR